MARSLLVVLLVVVCAGCDSTIATPRGPLATVMQERAGEPPPSDVTAGETWSAVVAVCGVDPFEPAKIKVTWQAATAGDQAWIMKLGAELVESSSHLVVEVTPSVQVAGKHLTPDAPWVDVATLSVHCQRKQFKFPRQYEQSLQSMVQFDAQGQLSVDGQAAIQGTPQQR